MNEAPIRLALLVSDRLPSPALAATLSMHGYQVEVVHSVDAAVRLLNHRLPALVVAGPFRTSSGLPSLLRKLEELAVSSVVVTDEPAITQLAERLGMLVRAPEPEPAVVLSPSESPFETYENSWRRKPA